MERVVKGIMGYGAEKEGKPATHVILTVDEYDHMLRQIRTAERDAENIKVAANNQIMAYKKQVDDIVANEKEKSQKAIEAIESDLVKANREIDRLNDLNSNLLRISRERANAKRGLKPKKVHHGYAVLDCQQYKANIRKYNSRSRRSESYDLPCWKLRIQTPYDCSMPFNVITKNISDDLVKIFGHSLGIKTSYPNNTLDNKSINEIEELWSKEGNFIFKTSYKSNYKVGLWEIEYLVKASVIVPEDMRAI